MNTVAQPEIARASEMAGCSSPLGATLRNGGVNFSVFSRDASGMELLLFDRDDCGPSRIIRFDPAVNRTYYYWHIFVPGLAPGQLYGYRALEPIVPRYGAAFDREKLLLDPYSRAVVIPENYSRDAASMPGDNAATAMKSVVADVDSYDWEGDLPLKRPVSQTIVYEMHVRGFTNNPNSGVTKEKRGTYAGVIEKIPYLKELGITAVELLPIFEFDEKDCPPGLVNYWGYAPISFFAPHHAYSSRKDVFGAHDEFRDMVKALHRANIEVILDVVYNHTAEGGATGPTLCYRGLDNGIYYILEGDGSSYANYSGTGNTLNSDHAVVRRMILESLRYWVEVMHVDGFRFDLASILARDTSGNVMPNPPILWDIELEPAFAGIKMIAEAWDAAGLYQVGSFIGDSWKEWNGKFRDGVRRFVRGSNGTVRDFAERLLGSPDIFAHEQREAEQSVNFVCCHDGFTLNDLVSYNEKHNEANGEQNCDGQNDNDSWNCGVEGPTDDPAIESLRNRQVKNFFTIALLSLGLPMILMGDEVRRTQFGNNNAYCHDDETTWFDWSLLEKHADIHRFVKLLNSRRILRDLEENPGQTSLIELIRFADKDWHGVKLNEPDWGDDSHSIAISAVLQRENVRFHWMINAYWQPLEFELPPIDDVGENPWRRWIDTALNSPEDIVDWKESDCVKGYKYTVGARSTALLYANLQDPGESRPGPNT
jgi:isoamylase